MPQTICASCGQVFPVRPQSPTQTYCSASECQRDRRRRWNKSKLESDPDYRANQLEAQRAWHARNPDYWKAYRQRRKAETPLSPQRRALATSDASSCGADTAKGLCWMEIRAPGPGGALQTWRIELTLRSPAADRNDARVQREDLMADTLTSP